MLTPCTRHPLALTWGIRGRKIYCALYSELRLLELEVGSQGSSATPANLAERIDRLDRRAHEMKLPASYHPMLYTLREHIALMRSRITEQSDATPARAPAAAANSRTEETLMTSVPAFSLCEGGRLHGALARLGLVGGPREVGSCSSSCSSSWAGYR